ncbi:MAG: hypothetical protein ACK4GU_06620 [Alishewanella aestuarii]
MQKVIFSPGLRRLTGQQAVYQTAQHGLSEILSELAGHFPQLAAELRQLQSGKASALRVFVGPQDVTAAINSLGPLPSESNILIFHPVSGG